MATAVMMPRQGQSVESCIVTKWHKKVGDPVKAGETLFSYETDKASFDEEAKADGVLLAILIEEGDDVPVLENVAVIGEPGEDISAFTSGAAPSETAPQPPVPASPDAGIAPPKPAEKPAVPHPGPVDTPGALPGDKLKISPRARSLAEEIGVDVTKAIPTGPEGRVIERDIIELSKHGDDILTAGAPLAAAAIAPHVANAPVAPDIPKPPHAGPGTPQPPHKAGGLPPVPPAQSTGEDFEDIKLSGVRKVIAKSMHASLSQMAQLTHTSSFDATDIMAYRAKLKQCAEALGIGNITLNDMVMYAVSRVLLNFPDLNAHYLDDKIRRFKSVNLGMAVDTPRGLLVPTIFNADKLSLSELSATAKALAKMAQEGNISPDYLTGASFTVSNLGSFGIESFTPVINPPQTGILGVDTITTRLKMIDSEPVAYQAMGLSLTYDHRALDGAPASKFLQQLCKTLENFTVLLSK